LSAKKKSPGKNNELVANALDCVTINETMAPTPWQGVVHK